MRATVRWAPLLLLFLVTAGSSPAPLGALCGTQIENTYYDICGPNKQTIGWLDRMCSCGVYGGGSQQGLFKDVVIIRCDWPYTVQYEYYARCSTSDPWTQVNGFDDCAPGC